MLRILSLTLSLILLIGVVIGVVGHKSSPRYQEEIFFELEYSTNLVWQELLNIKEIPGRKSDVESIQILEEFGKLYAWQENLKNGDYEAIMKLINILLENGVNPNLKNKDK